MIMWWIGVFFSNIGLMAALNDKASTIPWRNVCVDKKGILYTATRDGWIKRLLTNGTCGNWKKIHDIHTLLGLTVTTARDVIVCDTDEGLIKVSEDGEVTPLATHLNGANRRFANDVVEATDGSLYFSVATTKTHISANYQIKKMRVKKG